MEFRFVLGEAGRKPLIQATGEILRIAPRYLGAPTFRYVVGDCVFDKEGVLTIPDEVDAAELLAALEQRGFMQEFDRHTSIRIHVGWMHAGTLRRLEQLVAAKAALLRLALQADRFTVCQEGSDLCFDWFKRELTPEELNAYTQFFEALIRTARAQQRVTAKPAEIINPKYEMRCFLLKLGLIGEEYKATRRFILAPLPGNSSFKHGAPEA